MLELLVLLLDVINLLLTFRDFLVPNLEIPHGVFVILLRIVIVSCESPQPQLLGLQLVLLGDCVRQGAVLGEVLEVEVAVLRAKHCRDVPSKLGLHLPCVGNPEQVLFVHLGGKQRIRPEQDPSRRHGAFGMLLAHSTFASGLSPVFHKAVPHLDTRPVGPVNLALLLHEACDLLLLLLLETIELCNLLVDALNLRLYRMPLAHDHGLALLEHRQTLGVERRTSLLG
mmetsp:Transcript_36322/g.85202  ORF Transcript_36322/g.85202 Transcript_36322/m.85202 type:complete len:227 (-) Transcript_36322:1402-2082(-)